MYINFARRSLPERVVDIAEVSSETFRRRIQPHLADQAVLDELVPVNGLVLLPPAEGDVLGVGAGLAAQQNVTVVFALLDVALGFV